MSFKLVKLTFEGPYRFYSDLKDEPGIYVIIDDGFVDQWIIDVGESDQVRSRIHSHEREGCWNKMCLGGVGIGTLYMPNSTAQQRRKIVATICEEYGLFSVAARNCDKN